MYFDGAEAEALARASARDGEVVGEAQAAPNLSLNTDGSTGVYTPPPPSLDGLKAASLDAMQVAKAAALDVMAYDGHRVTISPVDIINVQGALGFLQAQAADPTMRWEVETNVFIDVDATWLQNLLYAGTAYVTACYAHASDLHAQILAAADATALAAIDVAAGWG